ncbi:MAG TPA: type IV pilus twitching motility protein PilT [Thermodesulfovibrionales bacterium]|nr:type IV pilus twitching motility protein PilT [Thermodesulfovibrionales bacterium]
MDINELLKKAVSQTASDVHIKVGSPPIVRVTGELMPMNDEERISQQDAMKIAFSVMSPGQREVFKQKNEIDLAYSVPGLGRFRCNIFIQRGTIGLVFRVISMRIPSVEELNLPEVIKKIAMEERGLVLVTGTTGSGKSTTLATMIDYINMNRTCNIVTIEDPIEYLHRDKKSIVNQREIGSDTESFGKALRSALRQDPDVILVGEMRDFETIQTGLVAAETGHLVFSTLHTIDATETVNRVIAVFPPYQHKQVRMQLSSVIKGIISMRLMPKADGKGRVPAVEVMIATATIKDCILDQDKTKLIPDVIAQSKIHYGMQTFDQSLFDLFKSGLITYEEALRRASSPDDFVLRVKGVRSTSDLTMDETIETRKTDVQIDRFAK